jgi:NitT/TauT family transport system substrate-binding protein
MEPPAPDVRFKADERESTSCDTPPSGRSPASDPRCQRLLAHVAEAHGGSICLFPGWRTYLFDTKPLMRRKGRERFWSRVTGSDILNAGEAKSLTRSLRRPMWEAAMILQDRRGFIAGLSAAGAAGLISPWAAIAEDAPLETTTIRLPAIPAACTAPLFLAKELLIQEGFTDVQYVPTTVIVVGMLADGDVDFSMEAALDWLPLMDQDRPLTVLAGMHVGCFELRANDSVRSIGDLRGKRVGINTVGATEHMLVSVMASYVGLNPTTDIKWIANKSVNQVDLFTDGEIDAFIGFPPDPKQPCERKVGHVVVNLAHDEPWSNYFCCMATANANFVRENPVATKRALRALLRATDICAKDPERAAKRMEDAGYSRECALMILNDARYGVWRDYSPEDTTRFFALRLHELGMIKKTPQEILAGYTDWRFVNELRRELS